MTHTCSHSIQTPLRTDSQCGLDQSIYTQFNSIHPREALDRARLATYFAWFDSGKWLRRPSYLFFYFSASVTCTYLRFRLGTHSLQVEVGRWQNRRPRCQRVCERCSRRRRRRRRRRSILHPCSKPNWAYWMEYSTQSPTCSLRQRAKRHRCHGRTWLCGQHPQSSHIPNVTSTYVTQHVHA